MSEARRESQCPGTAGSGCLVWPRLEASAILPLLLVLFLAIACSPRLKEGVIFNKYHDPPRTFVMFIPFNVCSGGRTPTCTTILLPYVIYDDEDWVLVLEDRNGDECRKGEVYTDQATYEGYKKGDYYSTSPGDQLKDHHAKHKASREEVGSLPGG